MIDKSCAANNYFVVFTICENETTIFPGLTHSNNEPHDCHSLFTDGVPLDVSHVRVLDATHIATLIVSVILYGSNICHWMSAIQYTATKQKVTNLASILPHVITIV